MQCPVHPDRFLTGESDEFNLDVLIPFPSGTKANEEEELVE